MLMRRFIAAVALAVGLMVPTAGGTTAHADTGLGPRIYFQIEGPRNLWGMRAAARYWDNRVDGMRIYTTGRHPWAYDIRVHVGNYGRTWWWGYTKRVAPLWDCDIYLNTYYGDWQGAAAHELGHALGLRHHRGIGVMTSPPSAAWPTWYEISETRAEFDNH